MTVTPDFKEATTRAAIRALRSLEQTAVMLEKWGPEAFPANEHGQVHFGRAITDSAAKAIRDAWTSAVVEVEAFPDDPSNWMEQRGKLRQALLEIAGELGAVLVQGAPSDDAILMQHVRHAHEIAKDALKSGLL